jgi:DNA-binding NarL/FixJ family response regulator
VLSGDLSAHWQARLLERRTASPPAPPLPSMLDDLRVTDRAVLAALLRGEPRTRIARANGLSLTSLNRAIRRLKDAAGVETLAELCAAAARLGLTDDATIVPFRPPRRTG